MPVGTTPLVTFAGITVNRNPLQIVSYIFVTAGAGFTVTVTVKFAPVQPAAETGVTV